MIGDAVRGDRLRIYRQERKRREKEMERGEEMNRGGKYRLRIYRRERNRWIYRQERKVERGKGGGKKKWRERMGYWYVGESGRDREDYMER